MPERVPAEVIQTRLGLEAALGEPDSIWLLDDFVRTPGIASTDLASELTSVDVGTGGLLSSRLGRAAEAIADIFAGRRRTLIGTERIALPLRAMVVQCPQGVAPSVEVTLESAETTSSALHVEFASIGGGPQETVTIAVRDRWTVTDPGSARYVVYSVDSLWEHWEVETRSGATIRYPKLASVDPSMAFVWDEVGPELPPSDWGESQQTTEFELSDAFSGSRTFRVEHGEEFDVMVGARVFGFGLEFGARTRRNFASAAAYELEAGHRYQAKYFDSVGAWWVSVH